MASIEDVPCKHGRPLSPIQEGGSGETELVDQDPEQHDPDETHDQFSNDDLTANAPQDEDEAR